MKRRPEITVAGLDKWLSDPSTRLIYASDTGIDICPRRFSVRPNGAFQVEIGGKLVYEGRDKQDAADAYNDSPDVPIVDTGEIIPYVHAYRGGLQLCPSPDRSRGGASAIVTCPDCINALEGRGET